MRTNLNPNDTTISFTKAFIGTWHTRKTDTDQYLYRYQYGSSRYTVKVLYKRGHVVPNPSVVFIPHQLS